MKTIRNVLARLRMVLGEGEYERFCNHLRTRHPEAVIPSPGEFYVQRTRERYSRPNRCC